MSRDPAYLLDIFNSAKHILEFVRDLEKEAFKRDIKTQDAVVRRFEIMGEASKRVSKEFKQMHPEVSWSDMARLRDLAIHHYQRIEPDVIWGIVHDDLPPLIVALEPLVPPDTDEPQA